MALIEDYALIGDTQTAALVGRDGSIDWLCVPALRLGRLLRRAPRHARQRRWLLAPAGEVRPRGAGTATTRSCSRPSWRPTSGVVRVIDFMPPRGRRARTSCASSRACAAASTMQMELVVRFDYGSIVPWVRDVDGTLVAIAGPDALVLRTPVEHDGRDFRTVADFVVAAGDRVPFVLALVPVARSRRPSRSTPEQRARSDDRAFWERVGRALHLRRRVARRRPALAASRSRRSRTRPPAGSSPRRRRRCPSGSAACATGTTATAGCATRPSRCSR